MQGNGECPPRPRVREKPSGRPNIPSRSAGRYCAAPIRAAPTRSGFPLPGAARRYSALPRHRAFRSAQARRACDGIGLAEHRAQSCARGRRRRSPLDGPRRRNGRAWFPVGRQSAGYRARPRYGNRECRSPWTRQPRQRRPSAHGYRTNPVASPPPHPNQMSSILARAWGLPSACGRRKPAAAKKCTRHRAHARTPRRQQAHYPLYVARRPRALCSLCDTPPGVCAHCVRSETRRLACAHYAHSATRPRHPCALCSLDDRKPPRYRLVHDTLGWTQRFVSTPVRGSMHVSNHPRRCGACV